jgi:tRNA pseudouridine(38-40) synthase
MSNELGKMEITKIIDNEDGSATVMFEMEWDAIRAFAKIGLMKVLTDAVKDSDIGLMKAMHEAAQRLVGLHDFTTFRSAHCQSDSPVKTLDRLDVRREGEHVLIEAAARSFLHHQVRSMVGCLAFVGMGRWTVDDLQVALEAKDRAALALNAPPDGLYFVRAVYP